MTQKSLEEINMLLSTDPMFYRIYLMRVNYYSRESKNPDIRKCEITHMVNKSQKAVISEAKQSYEQIKPIIENNEEAKMIATDIKKALELTKMSNDFLAKLSKTDFQAVMESNPRNSAEYFSRGYHIGIYFPNSRMQTFYDYEKVLELSPNYYPAAANLVTRKASMMKKGTYFDNFDQPEYTVLDDINKVIAFVPNYASSYTARSSLYSIMGDNLKAIHDLEKNLELLKMISTGDGIDVEISKHYHNRGNSFRQIGDYEQMLNSYNMAIETNPENNRSLNNRGFYYKRIGEYGKALNDFNSALRVYPNNSTSLYGRGTVYLLIKEYELAIKDFTANVSSGNLSKKGWTFKKRGMALLQLEMFEEAILDFTESNNLGIPGTLYMRNKTVKKLKEKIMRK